MLASLISRSGFPVYLLALIYTSQERVATSFRYLRESHVFQPTTLLLLDSTACYLAPSALTHPKFNLFVFCPLSTSLPLHLTDLAHGPRYVLHPEFNLFVFCPLGASPPLQPTDLGACGSDLYHGHEPSLPITFLAPMFSSTRPRAQNSESG
ncbi:hypothetical protein EDB86DRAFT_3084784 [Lactarius hatsudake]|nr:hypothetical protein EDB86DRAFT_3084784 [Lactarius hatsudake]